MLLLGTEARRHFSPMMAIITTSGLIRGKERGILYPTRKKLAEAVDALLKAGYPLDGASDHGVSEAIYLRDLDGIGIELYCDRPRSAWKKTPDGMIAMSTGPLDMQSLMEELGHGRIE
jgi:catechol-2,3-dioxygenase